MPPPGGSPRPTTSTPPASQTPLGGGLLAGAAQQAQQQLAGQTLAPVGPTHIVINGTDYGYAESELPTYFDQPLPGYTDDEPNNPDDVPNYEKLNSFERWVMDRLPGIQSTLTALGDWDTKHTGGVLSSAAGWLGKTLSFLDVGAEALERTTGLATQYLDAAGDDEKLSDLNGNLKAAWYAGGLAADMANASPKYDSLTGRISLPQDLPGIAGLTQARRDIADAMARGEDAGDALVRVRDAYYAGQGALALRSQLNDLFFHVLADPLNVVLPFIKPVERAQAARKLILASRASPEAVTELAQFATRADDVLTTAQDALRVAQESGIAERIAQATTDVTRLSREADTARTAAEAARRTQLSWAEQKLVALTGGDPTKPVDLASWRNRLNPLALTPVARAQEYLTTILDNVTSYVIGKGGSPEEWVTAIRRASDGTLGPEFGHMITTLEGRTVRAALQGFAAKAENLLEAHRGLGFESELTDLIGRTLNLDGAQVLKRLNAGEDAALWSQFTQRLAQNADESAAFTRLLQSANFDPATVSASLLGRVKAAFGKEAAFLAHTDEAFKVALLNELADHAAQQGIAQFGLAARGFLTTAAEFTKTAETLAFLKLNPSYPIRNWVNNTFTLLARGAFGTLTDRQIDAFWTKLGFEPARLRTGFGAAEVALAVERGEKGASFASALGQGARTIASAVEAEKGIAGWVQRMTDGLRGIRLGSFDASEWAARIEARASARAMTAYYQKGWQQFYPKLAGTLDDFDSTLVRGLGRDAARDIQHAVRNAMQEGDLDSLYDTNLRTNLENIIERANANSGLNIRGILDETFTNAVRDELPAWIARGPSAVRDYYASLSSRIDSHIQNAVDEAIDALRDETLSRVKTEGPGAFAGVWGDVIDDWYATGERHAADLQRIIEGIRRGGLKGDVLDAAWRRTLEDSERYYNRAWQRLGARMEGMARAGKEAGLAADDIVTTFKKWRGDWQDFFKFREKSLNDHFASLRQGETPKQSWDELQDALDARYAKISDAELRHTHKIDDGIASLLPDDQRRLYTAWRNRVSEWKAQDRQLVTDFRKTVRNLPTNQIDAAYRAHWQERIGNWTRQYQEERAGLAALTGNQAARARYAESVTRYADNEQLLDDIFQKRLANELLDANEVKLWDDFVDRNATPDEAEKLAGLGAADASQLRFNRESLYAEANSRGIETATPAGKPQEAHLINALNKYAPEGAEKFTLRELRAGLTDERLAEARYALTQRAGRAAPVEPTSLRLEDFINQSAIDARDARSLERSTLEYDIFERVTSQWRAGEQAPQNAAASLPDFHAFVPRELYVGTGLDELWYTKGQDALHALEQGTLDAMREKPLRITGLTPDAQAGVTRYLEHAKGAMADARYASIRFAEYGRDSALLNYSRRFNYNTWLGTMVPYEFWATQSAFKWALHSIDRPAMLATYLRLKKFIDTAYRPEQGLPSRLRGMIRIPLPFLPDWMGDEVFVDPLRLALPFDQWSQPFEEYAAQDKRDEGSADRKLDELLNDGKITQSEYDEAIQSHSGATWERAMSLVQTDDAEGRQSPFDFMSTLLPPHLPILYAYDAMRGRNPFEFRGPILTPTRSIGAVQTMLGIDPAGGLNVEAAVRKQLGLHPFSRWDDYLVDRTLANMVAEGELSAKDAQRAMIERQGDVYDLAYRRSNIERFGGNAIGALLGLSGLPVKAYPPGEEHFRRLQDEYAQAWADMERTGDYDTTVKLFNRQHPEYEARLALFDEPDERLRKFLTDELWSTYYSLPELNRKEVREQLGALFTKAFLAKDEATGKHLYTEYIASDTLAAWLKLMGGDPPGTLNPLAGRDLPPLDLAPRDVAYRAETFYAVRDTSYPDWREQSDVYFSLTDKAQKQYKKEHPEFADYLDWRNDWLLSNPDAAPYLTDKPPKYSSEAAYQAAHGAQGQGLTPEAWQKTLGSSLYSLVEDTSRGEALPASARRRLQAQANAFGWTGTLDGFVDFVAGRDGRGDAYTEVLHGPPQYAYGPEGAYRLDGGASEDTTGSGGSRGKGNDLDLLTQFIRHSIQYGELLDDYIAQANPALRPAWEALAQAIAQLGESGWNAQVADTVLNYLAGAGSSATYLDGLLEQVPESLRSALRDLTSQMGIPRGRPGGIPGANSRTTQTNVVIEYLRRLMSGESTLGLPNRDALTPDVNTLINQLGTALGVTGEGGDVVGNVDADMARVVLDYLNKRLAGQSTLGLDNREALSPTVNSLVNQLGIALGYTDVAGNTLP